MQSLGPNFTCNQGIAIHKARPKRDTESPSPVRVDLQKEVIVEALLPRGSGCCFGAWAPPGLSCGIQDLRLIETTRSCGTFEVYATIAVSGTWDHQSGTWENGTGNY